MTHLTIATWNVNSIKARMPNVLAWVREAKPDILLLQELKCLEEAFPALEFEDLGYNLAIHGQKTYNGVAILSKFPIEDVAKGLPGDENDQEARYIEAVISLPRPTANDKRPAILRIASVYVPNGQSPESEKFQYKLKFLERLREHMKTLLTYDEMLVIGGDYNVAPEDIDVCDPGALRGTVCFHPEEQKRLRSILHLGMTDVWRAAHPNEQGFSWWDYRGGGWERNHGMRIDHLLLSPQAADCVQETGIDAAVRGEAKASDHVPVWCTLAL